MGDDVSVTTDRSSSGKLRCSQCAREFSRLASLKSHMKYHQLEESFILCPECGEEFQTEAHLTKHINSRHMHLGPLVHGEVQGDLVGEHKQWSCSHCGQTFEHQNLYESHVKLHKKIKTALKRQSYSTNVDRTGFSKTCDVCRKTFKKNSQLVRHQRIHTGEKPFACDQCDMRFNQKNTLVMHKASKHSLGERKFKCKFCDATFTQPGNMRAHINRVHEPQATTPVEKLHKCPHCSCVFKKLGSLNGHIGLRHATEASRAEEVQDQLNSDNGRNAAVETAPDLLTTALEDSGVTSLDMTRHLMSKPGVKTIVPLTDTATGAKKMQIVRKFNNLSFHQCLYCPKEFKKSSDLVRHVRIHSQERPFKCSQCFRSFTVKSTLKAHLRTHSGEKNFTCEVCNNDFSTYQSLQVHFRLHTGALPYKCSICSKKLRTSGHLKAHLETHEKQGTGIVKEISIDASAGADSRVLLCDGQINEGVVRDSSSQTTRGGSLLSTGLSNQIIRKIRDYKCPHCEKMFKKSSHLTQHIRSHTKEKPYKCSTCHRGFVSNGSLKIHSRVHSGEKPYKCPQCSVHFTTKGSLARHVTTHSTLRQFSCPHCKKAFKSSLNCKKHMRTHRFKDGVAHATGVVSTEASGRNTAFAQATGRDAIPDRLPEANSVTVEPPKTAENVPSASEKLTNSKNSCDFCQKSFKKPSDLVRHVRIHTGEKPFVCNINGCTKQFTVKSTLDSHQLAHKGEKNFKCPECESLFATKGSLAVHRRLHTGARPFVCETCGQTFRTSGHKKSHMPKHSKEKDTSSKSVELSAATVIAAHDAILDISSGGVVQSTAEVIPTVHIIEHPTVEYQSFSLTPLMLPIEQLAMTSPSDMVASNFQTTATLDANMLAQIIQSDPSILQQLQQQGLTIDAATNKIIYDGDVITLEASTCYTDLPNSFQNLILCDNCKVTFEDQEAFDRHKSACLQHEQV